MTKQLLQINLFGACVVQTRDGTKEIKGTKHRALFVLLATAPLGRRTRSFLQDCLWGTACYDTGRQSLRRALSDIKSILGDDFQQLLVSSNSDITLDISKVEFIGKRGAGEFLEGIDLKEERFNEWLAMTRAHPAQLDSLFSMQRQAPARPSLPVIAIIPAALGAPDENLRALEDCLSAEISRALSRSNLISVISHLSSRAMARKSLDLTSMAAVANIDFCLAGSVRRNNGTVIFDADFIDVFSGRILWSRRFEGKLQDFLSADAPGLSHIVSRIGSSIADDAISHLSRMPLGSIDEHKLLMAGVGLMHRPRLREFAKSKEAISELLARAPRSAEAHAWLAKWHVLSAINNWSTDTDRETRLAIDSTARALDIDPQSTFSLTIDGFAHNNLLKRLDIAGSRYAEALRVNPNESLAWMLKGMVHAFQAEPDRAVDHVEKARALSPLDPFGYFFDSLTATAYLSGENYSAALKFADLSLQQHNSHTSTHRVKTIALQRLGRKDEAVKAAKELLKVEPGFTTGSYLGRHPAGDFRTGRDWADALSEAGIPTT